MCSVLPNLLNYCCTQSSRQLCDAGHGIVYPFCSWINLSPGCQDNLVSVVNPLLLSPPPHMHTLPRYLCSRSRRGGILLVWVDSISHILCDTASAPGGGHSGNQKLRLQRCTRRWVKGALVTGKVKCLCCPPSLPLPPTCESVEIHPSSPSLCHAEVT